MTLSIRRNDSVVVLAGKEKGKRGRVLKILTERNRALVEKLNMLKKHAKPGKANPQGGIIEKEGSIHLSNLLLYCEKCSRGVRTGMRLLKDGSKVRFCRRCEEVLDKT